MSNLEKYLTIKLFFERNMVSQKNAIVTAVSEWNKLYSEYHNKEIVMNEEEITSFNSELSQDTNNVNIADLSIYLLDNSNNNELTEVLTDNNVNLKVLTNKSFVFCKYIEKDKYILNDLKVLITQKINEIEKKLSEYDIFNLFEQLDNNNLSLLSFAIDTNNIYLYPHWVNKTSFNLLNNWGRTDNFSFKYILYEETLSNLAKLNLLEVVEYTEYGNPRLYRLPYEVLNKFIIYSEIILRV